MGEDKIANTKDEKNKKKPSRVLLILIVLVVTGWMIYSNWSANQKVDDMNDDLEGQVKITQAVETASLLGEALRKDDFEEVKHLLPKLTKLREALPKGYQKLADELKSLEDDIKEIIRTRKEREEIEDDIKKLIRARKEREREKRENKSPTGP